MKKLILAAIIAMFTSVSAYADLGVNVGVSGQIGLFAASATENDTGSHGTTTGTNEKNTESEFISIGYTSWFIEKTLGSKLFVGIDVVPDALETETSESARQDKTTSSTPATVTNKVQVDFEDLTTIYVGLNITDNLYAKAGSMSVDVNTKESLGTGSTYGNTSLDGTMYGVGYAATNDSGLFVRVEGNYLSFDGASLTSSSGSQKITLDNLDGLSGKLSVGKSF